MTGGGTVLSPTRAQHFGTDDLNWLIQRQFKGGLIAKAQQPWSKCPRPFGEQEIVWTDKVRGAGSTEGWDLLHDWQLLRVLNGLPSSALTREGGQPAPDSLPRKDGGVLEQARVHISRRLPELGLEFHLPLPEIVAALFPDAPAGH